MRRRYEKDQKIGYSQKEIQTMETKICGICGIREAVEMGHIMKNEWNETIIVNICEECLWDCEDNKDDRYDNQL